MSIEALLFNGFAEFTRLRADDRGNDSSQSYHWGCMRNRQSSYEIVEDCSNKGGHRHQPLHRFILREVLARRRVMFMLRVMTYVVSYKLFWYWFGIVRFQVVSHEICSDQGFIIWHFLYCLQILSLWSLSIWIRIISYTNALVNQTRHWNQMPHRLDPDCYSILLILYVNHYSQITGQNLFPLINKIINSWINWSWALAKICGFFIFRDTNWNPQFFVWCQAPNFENVTMVACKTERFWGFGRFFWLLNSLKNRVVLIHKNSLASCQLVLSQCRVTRTDASFQAK